MTHILDPIVENRERLEPESDLAIRISYAKLLRYVGLNTAAELLVDRKQWKTFEDFTDIQWNTMSLVPLGYAPIGGLVTVERNVFETLRDGNLKDLRSRLKLNIAKFSSQTNSTTTNDGVIVLRNGIVIFVTDTGQRPKGGFPWPLSHPFKSVWYEGTHVCDPQQ